MKVNSGAAGAALLSVTTSVSIFHSMLPPFSEVRKSTGEVGIVNDVRAGELASSALVIGLGVTATALVNSPVPLVASVLSVIVLIAVYERMLATPPKEMKTDDRSNIIPFRR